MPAEKIKVNNRPEDVYILGMGSAVVFFFFRGPWETRSWEGPSAFRDFSPESASLVFRETGSFVLLCIQRDLENASSFQPVFIGLKRALPLFRMLIVSGQTLRSCTQFFFREKKRMPKIKLLCYRLSKLYNIISKSIKVLC